jgi:hypothetical protein
MHMRRFIDCTRHGGCAVGVEFVAQLGESGGVVGDVDPAEDLTLLGFQAGYFSLGHAGEALRLVELVGGHLGGEALRGVELELEDPAGGGVAPRGIEALVAVRHVPGGLERDVLESVGTEVVHRV